ncbi:hypothetical protein ACIBL3_39335 [Kribbella sp. NPDC050124]|uniref:hypothetical protein n=1 Tax=Kribbella sp. NPDC050124 TaxID=3364114 RepID=UPI0037AE9260
MDGTGQVITNSPKLADDRASVVAGLGVEAEARSGDLAGDHRLDRAALHDAAADVGPTGV